MQVSDVTKSVDKFFADKSRTREETRRGLEAIQDHVEDLRMAMDEEDDQED